MIDLPQKPRPVGARKTRKSPTTTVSQKAHNGYATAPDGTRIFYSVEGTGEPLIFCYGLVCSSLHWTYQIDHFKNSHQSVWFDYRGHHNSESPADLSTLTIPHFARDLASVLDAIKIDKAVILGHSMGSSVALEFYRQHPARVKALVLANGTAKRPLETLLNNPNIIPTGFQLLKAAYARSPSLFTRIWKLQKGNALVRTIVKLAGFNPHLAADEDVERYVSQIEDMHPATLLNVLDTYQTYDATAWLHTIDVPTLILSGDEDKVTPPAQQLLLRQLIPASQLENIRHGSHCPQMDQPELVTARIEKFLQGL
jgi:pimeloyl-ACP methyl ester carboxylesterase